MFRFTLFLQINAMNLLNIVHFDNNHTDVLDFLFGLNFGNVPVGGEKDDELARLG